MAIQYYMRAFNTNSQQYVDWIVNDTPDSTGTFSGFPSNQLINITVNRVVQSKVANFLKPNQSLQGTDGYYFHVNAYDWKNAVAPLGPPTNLTGFAVERGITSVANISSASNTTPVTITTATNHNLSSGQLVTIIGVTGNLNANGSWPITVTSLTTFTLNGSTGSGAPNPGTGIVFVPNFFSSLMWDENSAIWRFVQNTNGDGTTLGPSQSVKVNNFLIDGYLALGSPTASQGIIRLPDNQFIFARDSLNNNDVQLIGLDSFPTSAGTNRIKLGATTTDFVYLPGNAGVDGYIQHNPQGGLIASTNAFINDKNNTTIVGFRNQLGLADIAALGSTATNNIVLGDAVNATIQYNTATGGVHQFQVNSVPEVEIGLSFIRFPGAVVLPTIFQNTAAINSNGQTLIIQAQNAANSGTGTGGNLNLTSGAGVPPAGTTANGVINLQTGGVTRISVSDNTETYSISNLIFTNLVPLPLVTQNGITASTTTTGIQSLPTGTINVASTAGFATAGTLSISTSAGQQVVAYTGTSGGNQFTGCTGGLGNTSNGGAVVANGEAFTIQAQASGSAAGLGGNLVLSSGLGGIVANDGYLVLQSGGMTQMIVTASNLPAKTFPTSAGKVTITGNLEVQGTLTTVDSTTVDIVGAVIHGNWSDPSQPPVGIPTTVVGYASHRGSVAVGQPRDGVNWIWTEGPTANNSSFGVTSAAGLYASDGLWRAISTPGDGFGVDGYTASNSFASLGILGNNFSASIDPNPVSGALPGTGGLRTANNLPSVVARNLTPTTVIAAASNLATLPTTPINVNSTAGFTSSGSLLIATTNGTFTTVTYTGTSGGNQFTGVAGGSGTLNTGAYVVQTNASTTIAAGSNGQTVPGVGNIISVASTTGFPQTGTLRVVTYGPLGSPIPGNGSGVIQINYTGVSGNTFTGCTIATGSPGGGFMWTGNAVQLAPIAGGVDLPLLGTDGYNHVLHGFQAASGGPVVNNTGHIFNTTTTGIYDFWVNNISQIQLGNPDYDNDGYAEVVQISPTIVNPRFLQATQPNTGANVGFNMMLQAQAGQQQTGANANNNGGILTLASGAAGTGGSGAAGVAGVVTINVGSVNNSTFNNIDPDADGYAEWLAVGPTILNPRLYQATLPGTGTSVGTNFKINAQAGQNVSAGTNNNGGNLVLASGLAGTGGTAGTNGQIELFWGNTLELTLTDGTLQWSNLVGNPPTISQAGGVTTGQTFTIQAQNATATGGNLTLTSGSGTTNGNVNVQTGGGTRVLVTTSFTAFNDSTATEALRITPVSAGTTQITYASTVTAAQINQTQTAATPSAPMTIQSQVTTATSGVGGNLSLIAGNATGTTSTGGNINVASGSGTTTNGTINFQPGGTTQVLITSTGQFIQWVSTLASPTLNQATTGGASGQTLTVQAQNAVTTGGNLALTSGTGTTAGNVNLQTGGSTRVSVNPTFTSFSDTAEALRITPVSAGTTQITFASTDTAVQVNQTTTGGATGATMTVQAQNAATTGGNLNVTSGTGGTTNGTVNLQAGGTTVASVVTNKFVNNQGHRRHVTAVTGTYQVLATDDYLAITTISAPFTITLPAAPTTGDEYWIKDTTGTAGTNNITVSGNGNNIDGTATITLSQNYAAVIVTFTGTSWSLE